MASDIRVTCGLNRLARLVDSAFSSRVYRYVVTARPSSPVMYYGTKFTSRFSFSGFDLLALLDTLDQAMPDASPDSSDIRFGNILRTDFVNFARSGRPAHYAWGAFPGSTAVIGHTQEIHLREYHAKQCEELHDLGLLDYSWQN